MLAVGFGLRNDVELFQRKFTRAFRTNQANRSAICNQYWNNRGRADELCRTVVAEDRVIAILACSDQIFAGSSFGQKAEAAAEIPAARTLAQVASKRGHVANLRAGGVVEGFRQRRDNL